MRIRFQATGSLREYRGWFRGERIIFYNGEEKDLPDEKAGELLCDFPNNFLLVMPEEKEIAIAPADRMFRRGKSKRK